MPRKTLASLACATAAGWVVFTVGYFSGPAVNDNSTATAAENPVAFPPLDQLVHYATVRRGVSREHMLTNPEALAAIKAGQPVAIGTHVVLVDYQSDILHRYLVAQKMGEGSSEWAYQWFWPDKSIKADENTAQCYSCHRSREDRQFMFTFTDALSFK